MNILMMSNTYTPLVGGLERSVRDFAAEYRRRGHRVIVVAPTFEGMPEEEPGVIRLPAIQHFNGSDFSLQLPIPGVLSDALRDFQPDVVHAHHPFLMGNTALRVAYAQNVPLVFTHHTLFEQYTHYLPIDTEATKRFTMELATQYANLCDLVFAPSRSVADLLVERGVTSAIKVVPTGIDVKRFAKGDGASIRQRFNIPAGAVVVGHVGRLAPEKNLEMLGQALTRWLQAAPDGHALIIGDGPSKEGLEAAAGGAGVGERLHAVGVLQGQELIDAYHAMDLFAFSSKSETQGLVVAEAMAAGLPVVAVDAPGVREVVVDQENGRLLPDDEVEPFAQALQELAARPPQQRQALVRAAQATAKEFSLPTCATRALKWYTELRNTSYIRRADADASAWATALRWIEGEWGLVKGLAAATGAAMGPAEDAPVSD